MKELQNNKSLLSSFKTKTNALALQTQLQLMASNIAIANLLLQDFYGMKSKSCGQKAHVLTCSIYGMLLILACY